MPDLRTQVAELLVGWAYGPIFDRMSPPYPDEGTRRKLVQQALPVADKLIGMVRAESKAKMKANNPIAKAFE